MRIPISRPWLTEQERRYVEACMKSGWISSLGDYVLKFEDEFASYCGCRYGISVNSGTAALHLALCALGVGPGDEVIIPALTFAATANAVIYTGARPVFADSSPGCWNIDPSAVERLIGPKTRAIIPVHLFGLPCRMDELCRIADKHGIPIIEDAAEAHGATFAGRVVGSMGKVGCFSFYGNKLITTGEGGMCVTSDEVLASRMRLLRDHGMDKTNRYWHVEIGFNYRMTNPLAAIGCAQLERIEEIIKRRHEIRDAYAANLAGLPVHLPDHMPPARNVFWLMTLVLEKPMGRRERDALIHHLTEHSIDARPFFYPVPTMPPYASYAVNTPHATSWAERGLMLPTYHELTEGAISYVCKKVRSWFHRVKH